MNEIGKILSLLERIDPQYKQYKLLFEKDSRLSQVDKIIDTAFAGVLDPDANVSDREYYVNGNPNTTWRQYLLFNLRHTFGLMQNSDVKYLPTVARFAYSDEVRFDMTNDNNEQVNTLRRIVGRFKKDDALFQQVKNNPDITFGQMVQQFKAEFAQEDAADEQAANAVQNTGSDYTIVDVPDFKTAQYYGDRSCSSSKLCYTDDPDTWNDYTHGGRNRAYVCLRNGWENIPETPTEGNPYDLYGTSMIFVFITPSGNISASNCRWNHATVGEYDDDVDHAFTKATLSRTIGMPFDSVFKPMEEYSYDNDLMSAIEEGDTEEFRDNLRGDFVIPDGIRRIGEFAFYNCKGLTSVTIPDSVTAIGEFAFYNCRGLTSVTIPDSVTAIGTGAFCDCTGLTSVTIPDSFTEIGYAAFSGCSGLTSVTIPDSVTEIGSNAFLGCHFLTIYVTSEQTAHLIRQSGFDGKISSISNG